MKRRKMLRRLEARIAGWRETMNSVKMSKFSEGYRKPGSQNRNK